MQQGQLRPLGPLASYHQPLPLSWACDSLCAAAATDLGLGLPQAGPSGSGVPELPEATLWAGCRALSAGAPGGRVRAPPSFFSLDLPTRSTALVTALSSAHTASCTFLVGSQPALPTTSPGALRLRGGRPAPLLPNTQGPSPEPPLESSWC